MPEFLSPVQLFVFFSTPHLQFGRLFCIFTPCLPHRVNSTLVGPAVCVYCRACAASRRVSTCWRHQRRCTQEVWLHSLQQGWEWERHEREIQVWSACRGTADQSGYLVTGHLNRLSFHWNASHSCKKKKKKELLLSFKLTSLTCRIYNDIYLHQSSFIWYCLLL